MTTLLQARQYAQAGNYPAAREIINAILRDDPYNAEAWQLAIDLAPNDADRDQARIGLQNSLASRPQPQPYPQAYLPPQPYIAGGQPLVANAPRYPYQGLPEKDYMGEAIITLLLYFFGAGVIGLIANIFFLMNANRDRDQGMYVRNAGCLQALLVVNVLGMIVACVAVAIIFIVPLVLGGVSSY